LKISYRIINTHIGKFSICYC